MPSKAARNETRLHTARRQHAIIRLLPALVLSVILALGMPGGTAGLSLTAFAQNEPETVRVGYYENELFQEGAAEGAVKTGYAYEYYCKLSEYTGWKYEYIYGSFGDLYQGLLDGEIDLLAGLARREDRESLIGYPDAIMGSESYYLLKHDTDTAITADPGTMQDKRIGVLDSAMLGTLNRFLEEHHVTADVIPYSDSTDLFEAFDGQQLDVAAVESDGAYGRDHAQVLSSFGAADYYLCVNKARPDLLERLNTAQTLLAAEEPNYLNSLREKYYSASVTSRAFSEAEISWILSHRELHIGYLEDYLPYSDTGSDGTVTGMIRDIIPEILNALNVRGITVTYSGYQSYDTMIADMSSGTIDAAFPVGGGLYYSEENGIYQSSPVVSTQTELVYKGEFSDASTARFAVNENNRMQYYYIRTNFPDSEIAMYDSIDRCLEAVLNGEAGCTTLNGLRANDILKNRRYNSLSQRQSSRSDDRCFGVEIGNEGLLKLLNRGISVLGSDYAQTLSYRYMSGLYSYSILDILQDHVVPVMAVLAAVAALIISLLVRDSRRTKNEVREKEAARQELEAANRDLAASREALTKALAEAESANQAKTVFLNNMSHDIRTPMNAIVGFTTLAASHIDQKELVRDYLDKISVSSSYLLSLINDVLDMSRIESGNLRLNEGSVCLPDAVRDLETIVQPDVEAKHLTLHVDAQDIRHAYVFTDRLRLNQILLNILSNAIKFTPEGGMIHLNVREQAEAEAAAEKPSGTADGAAAETAYYEFRIRDNGIGMSEAFRKTIFEAFTREQTSTVSGIQGTGLGMAITKNIVDKMGGTISVQSREGEGSEFTVVLPLRPDMDAAAAAKGAAADENAPADGADSTVCAESAAAAAAVPDFSGKRILLAEDNALNRMIALTILEEAGFTIEVAENGEEAVEKMTSAPAGHFDIILMDIQMPKMDGYEAAKRIRALEDPVKAGIPIVAVTANAFEEDRRVAMEAGMNGHLAKPYDIPAIMETLQRLLLK